MYKSEDSNPLVLKTAQAGNWHEWVLIGGISLLFGIIFLLNRDKASEQMIGWILIVGGGLGIWSGFQRQKDGWIVVLWYKYGELTWMIFSKDAVLDESYSNPHLWTGIRITNVSKGLLATESFMESRFEVFIKTIDEPEWASLFPDLPEAVVFYQQEIRRFLDWIAEYAPDLEVQSGPTRKTMDN